MYATDLFEQETIRRMMQHWRNLLTGIVNHPTEPLSQLSLLSEAETNQLLYEWNDTHTAIPSICIHHLFEQQVELTPEAIAVISEGEQLSYRELNRRANQLAHYLRAQGVGAETLVGLSVERSVEMVVGLLGVLKAGGAYVPLDVEYPAERLKYMLEDAAVKVLLTQEHLVERLPSHDARIIRLDADWEAIARENEDNIDSGVQPDNLLYLIYTSGSTGRPKGIGLSHNALSNLICWHQATLSRGAKMIQFASLSFDASFHEIFATWCSGGTLFLISEALRHDMAGLARYILGEEIEKAILPVVVLQQLAQEFERLKQYPTSLREVITTGEQIAAHHASDKTICRAKELHSA